MKTQLLCGTILLAGAASGLAAQDKLPPIRPLGAVTAASTDSFGIIGHVRALSSGNVLVNDVLRRRVLLLDPALKLISVVADSTSSTANAYGQRPGGLIAYRGDSTLFVDPASLSMLLIDPAGKIARVMSVPRSQEVNALTSISFGVPGFDAAGRLVYRANPDFMRMARTAAGAVAGGAMPAPPDIPDSAAIVRLDLATRKLDTVAFIKVPKIQTSMNREPDGRMIVTQTVNPLPLVDEWVVTSEGRVAVLRSSDYHVDWVGDDGRLAPAPKVPFEWQRLTDEDKSALIDSVRTMRERMAAQPGGGGPQVMFGGGPMGAAMGGGGTPQVTVNIRTSDGPGAPSRAAPVTMNIMYVSPSELPDYKPPFLSGAARADADGNIWVRTVPTKQIPGGPVYDVIDGKGQLAERVQIPANREVRGFGPGVVYLMGREGGRTVIEAARIR